MNLFLNKNVPLISKELLNPWRVASLGIGLVMLVLGSVYLPSDDWDVPLCFVMGLPAYVLAPWTVRQAFGLRWKWLVPAALAFWLMVDGTYTLYWWMKDFPHLARFRPANFFYCTPIFWIAGCWWNVDFKNMEWRLPKTLAIESVRLRVWRSLRVVLVIAAMIGMVGYMVEFSLPSCVQDAIAEVFNYTMPIWVLAMMVIVVVSPIYIFVCYQRYRWKRREQERMSREMAGKEHPHFTLDRTKRPKGKLKHVEANTMPLSLRKLVRTGTPYDKGVMG